MIGTFTYSACHFIPFDKIAQNRMTFNTFNDGRQKKPPSWNTTGQYRSSRKHPLSSSAKSASGTHLSLCSARSSARSRSCSIITSFRATFSRPSVSTHNNKHTHTTLTLLRSRASLSPLVPRQCSENSSPFFSFFIFLQCGVGKEGL